jgi:ABC-type microcin C transport system permease subunit YejB
MNRLKLALVAALFGVCTVTLAAVDVEPGATRDQRMDEALQHYRDGADRDASRAGPAARAEASAKRGLHRAGSAIKRGAEKTSHAVKTGVHKTGDAIHRTGEKIEESTRPAQ